MNPACTITFRKNVSGRRREPLHVTVNTATELVRAQIIKPAPSTLGRFTMCHDREDDLWLFLRNR